MYLWFRFKTTGEDQHPPDFTENMEWFFTKLLVPSQISIVNEVNGVEVVDRSGVSKEMRTTDDVC
jgi:hypothetical protein